MNLNDNPISILLVEDSQDDVFFFRRAVAKSGVPATIHVAVDGVQAIDYLLRQGQFADPSLPAPDIMFLDLKLPHVNGFEVMEWMRQNPSCAPMPVVVLSSSSQAEDRLRAEQLGATKFLTKPPVPEQVREILCSLRRSETADRGIMNPMANCVQITDLQ